MRAAPIIRLVLVAVACLAAVVPASATSYVMMPDSALVERAQAVVQVRILSGDFSPAEGMPSTDYLVEVERLVAGDIPGSTLVVRVPGGVGPEGGLVVYGAPRFEPGQEALLFLVPGPDGAFRTVQLMMGAFHVVEHRGERLAVRNFSGAREVPWQALATGAAGEELERSAVPRKLEEFSTWIGDRARGQVREPDYFHLMTEQEQGALYEGFRVFVDQGRRMRWFFEDGDPVEWRLGNQAQAGLNRQQLERALGQATSAWNNVGNTDIRYRAGASTASTGGLTRSDGVNSILFEDPNDNSTFDGAFTCSQGGVLAIGGPWIGGGRQPQRIREEETYWVIGEADIVTNKGLGCFFNRSIDRQQAIEELLAHELGHTLGIDHSSEIQGEPSNALREALMFFLIRDDGRGARLNEDDVAAARRLYGTRGGGPTNPGPAAPSRLEGTVQSPTTVRLTWRDNSSGETGFEVQQRVLGGQFVPVPGTVPANVGEKVVTGLTPGTVYDFKVRAVNGDGPSGFSNTVRLATPPGAPAAPGGLTAVPLSTTQIRLRWTDRSADEEQFTAEMRSPGSDWIPAGVAPAGAGELVVSGLTPRTPYTFQVRARNDVGASPASNEASATTRGAIGPCVADGQTLCLLDDRFEVGVRWRNQFMPGDNGFGQATPVPGSDVSGMFWFFDSSNIELIVKMLDGRTLNDFFWTFYGSLSTVEYWISVRDTDTGESVTYHNPADQFCGRADVSSFPPGDSFRAAPAVGGAGRSLSFEVAPAAVAGFEGGLTGTCEPGPTTLCLLDDRFRVEVDWINPRAPFNQGPGTVVSVPTVQTDQIGFFWFFQSDNIELVVKLLDAQVINGHFWFFFGALTDVEYQITVTDTLSGQSKLYHNEPFSSCGKADTQAF